MCVHIIILILNPSLYLTIIYIFSPQHESAEAEVERLCDIVERAADALRHARRVRHNAQKELNSAAKAAQGITSPLRTMEEPPMHSDDYDNDESVEDREEYESVEATDEEDDEDYEASGQEDEATDEGDEEEEDDDVMGGFDMGDEALEQVRYRLESAKIIPNSPLGTKILDKLLIQLQNADLEVIDVEVVNEFIDKLLFNTEEDVGRPSPLIHDPKNPELPILQIYRGGVILGWYQGQLDDRGYVREGKGSMYYDAGHECHGTWKNDEMIGRGIYKWSDGHIYDGDWSNGKRHGLGRFNRPDNVILFGRYVNGHHKGEGVRWSADRIEAQLVVDGMPKKTITLSKAKEIAVNLGFVDTLPPPVVIGGDGKDEMV
jgi:hypothetical protein